MNPVELKYQPRQRKGQSNTKSTKKFLFSKVPATALMTNEEQELLRITLEARDEWIEISSKFEYVHEEMLVDYYTYRMKACESKYAYFIKLVKEKGLSRYI